MLSFPLGTAGRGSASRESARLPSLILRPMWALELKKGREDEGARLVSVFLEGHFSLIGVPSSLGQWEVKVDFSQPQQQWRSCPTELWVGPEGAGIPLWNEMTQGGQGGTDGWAWLDHHGICTG